MIISQLVFTTQQDICLFVFFGNHIYVAQKKVIIYIYVYILIYIYIYIYIYVCVAQSDSLSFLPPVNPSSLQRWKAAHHTCTVFETPGCLDFGILKQTKRVW